MNRLLYPIKNMSLNIKYFRAIISPKLKTLIYDINCVKNNVHPENVKNENGAVAMGIFFVQLEWKQQLHQLKNENIGEYNNC